MAYYRCFPVDEGEQAISITPSNSSPVSMTANTAYKPTVNGVAVASVANITPSNSSPVTLTSGDIDKIGGSGYAIESYLNLYSFSDTSPATLTKGNIIKLGQSGYAVQHQPTAVTPSDSTPATLSANTLYRTSSTSGYAIASQPSSKTPDDSNPPSVSSGEIVKVGGSGYLYATQQSSGGTETTLWENPDYTANFNTQDVTLSDKYTNYTEIRFYYRRSTSMGIEIEYVAYPTADISRWAQKGETVSGIVPCGAIAMMHNTICYIRQIRRGETTKSFYITIAYRANAAGNSQIVGVPTKITGVNY